MNSNLDIWNLLRASNLLQLPQVDQLQQTYEAQYQSTDQAGLLQWLQSQNAITAYQSQVLAAGAHGPFFYGDYVVHDRIASGPFNGCFRAKHQSTSHPVILKFLTGSVTTNAQVWFEIAQEARLHGQVRSLNLIRLFEVVDLTDFKFLVFEDKAGGPLKAGKVDAASASRVLAELASGLNALHAKNQVHGHIALQHLFYDPKNKYSWLNRDPLQSPIDCSNTQKMADPLVLQFADYAAPELGIPGAPPTVQSDIYALGCLGYELIMGRPPFVGGDLQQKISAHATARPQSLPSRNSEVEQIILTMMAKSPQARYQTMAQVAAILQGISKNAPTTSRPAPKTLPPFEQVLAGRAQPAYQPAYQQQVQQPVQSNPFAAQAAPAPVVQPVASPAQPTSPAQAVAQPAASPAQPAANVNIPVSKSPASTYPVRRKNKWILPAVLGAVGLITVVGGYFAVRPYLGASVTQNETDNDPEKKDKKNGKGAAKGTSKTDPISENSFQTLISDDSKTLWESPTVGNPMSLSYVPQNGRVFFGLRPSEILATEDGELIMASLGPGFTKVREEWEKEAGFPLSEVSRLLLSYHDSEDGTELLPSNVIELAKPIQRSEIIKKLGSPKPKSIDDENDIYELASGRAAFFPEMADDGSVGRFIIASNQSQIEQIVLLEGAEPNIQIKLRQQRKMTDDSRHFNLMFNPASLLDDAGQKLFLGPYRELIEVVKYFVDSSVPSVLVSAHLDGDLYLEMMAKNPVSSDAFDFSKSMRTRMESGQADLRSLVRGIEAGPYWRDVQFSYDQWIQKLYAGTRIGVEEKTLVVNCWMPRVSTHNLIAASELVVTAKSSGGFAPPTTTATNLPKSIEELIAKKWDIDIPADDLNRVIDQAEEGILDDFRGIKFPFEIVFRREHLEEAGITQNQTIKDFKMSAPIREILTALVVKANGTPSTGPTDTAQKLMWVIGPHPTKSGQQAILITTRKGATDEKMNIPKEFTE